MATYHVENFGCRATQADGAAIERQLCERGFERAAAASQAEVVVLNTCTVTASADQDARAAIRRIHRTNPDARILVTGCYAQRAPAELSGLPGVSLVVGNSHKHQLADYAVPLARNFVPAARLSGVPDASVVVGDIFAHTELMAAPGRDVVFLDAFFVDTGIRIDWNLDETVWRLAGEAYQAYAARRRKYEDHGPRRILADFVIGAHALRFGCRLLTLDSKLYRASFPKLVLLAV